MKFRYAFFAALVFFVTSSLAGAQDAITVDPHTVIADVSRRPIGINMNFLLDDDGSRTAAVASLAEALRHAGVKYLRYPGGEKSDAYLWSVPPYTHAEPTLARWAAGEWPLNQEWPSYDRKLVETDGRTFKASPLDFDEFMAICDAIDCVPTIVVCYDSMYKPAQTGGVAPTRAQLLETAREWVRYANIVKGYNVQYWEIGNETWLPHYNGSATAANYARDLIEFSRVMKEVDPTIRIGANGESDAWWKTVLTTASGAIDFLAVHNYPAMNWGSFTYYATNTVNLTRPVTMAQNAINAYAPAADRARLRIAATEINSADWSGAWPHVNDLGHAIVLFDTFGEHLRHPSVEYTQLWNTRWSGNDTVTTPALWDALDKHNALQATGRATAIWGEFLKEQLVAATSTPKVRSYATRAPATGKLTVFLINKDSIARPSSITLKNTAADYQIDTWIFSGTGAQDLYPTWTLQGRGANAGNVVSVTLPPVSVTVLDLTPTTRVHAVPAVIQAEDFNDGSYWDQTPGNSGNAYRATDVDIQATSDGGGYNVGWVSAGEWLEYDIRVDKAGFYDLGVRVAAPYSGKALRLDINGQGLTGGVAVPYTGGWQRWATVTRTVFLVPGIHRLRMTAVTNGFNLNWLSVATSNGPTHHVPAIIQAEDFLEDGYWDSTAGNAGGAYRGTNVDLQATADAGGGYNVGWIAAGEWLEYEIIVPASGYYDFTARLASPHAGRSFSLLLGDVSLAGVIAVPTTGAYQKWRSVTVPRVHVPAGTHRLRLKTTTGGFNLNWIALSAAP